MRYILLFAALTLFACSQPKTKETKAYRDLKGFFESEALRLQRAKAEVKKTVGRNSDSETKVIKNINWKTELSLFTESDINKPAWRDSYKVLQQSGKTTYLATDSNLRTRELSFIIDAKGKITKVNIVNQAQNLLYSTTEQLIYIPDSIYQINKQQHVVLLGENRYLIIGKFLR